MNKITNKLMLVPKKNIILIKVGFSFLLLLNAAWICRKFFVKIQQWSKKIKQIGKRKRKNEAVAETIRKKLPVGDGIRHFALRYLDTIY